MGYLLLVFIPFSIVLVPVLYSLLFLVRLLCQVILSIFWKQARMHFTLWPPDSSFFDPGPLRVESAVHVLHEKLGVCRYVRGAADDGEQMKCVFCLCPVEDGDEIRELGCRHLFHRACLDKWVEHGRAACPLCRGPLLPPGSWPSNPHAAEEELPPEDFTFHPSLHGVHRQVGAGVVDYTISRGSAE